MKALMSSNDGGRPHLYTRKENQLESIYSD